MSKSLKTMREEFENDFLGVNKCLADIANKESIDMVLNPPHYNQGGIETIDYMKAYSTKKEFMGHCRLTAIKYLSRLMEKEDPIQDAKKARWYIDKLIEELEC